LIELTIDQQLPASLSPIGPNAASIEKPIHNVKVPMNSAEAPLKNPARRRKLLSSFLEECAGGSHPLKVRNGGAYRDRTDDPLLAKQVLSQLS
jgi:hypothetical protein